MGKKREKQKRDPKTKGKMRERVATTAAIHDVIPGTTQVVGEASHSVGTLHFVHKIEARTSRTKRTEDHTGAKPIAPCSRRVLVIVN